MHPTLRIFAFILLAVALQFMNMLCLATIGCVVLVVALIRYPLPLRKMLHRSRWLLLTMTLLYAFTTPGEYVVAWPFAPAPTYEGLQMGAHQAGRLIAMLAGLVLLLESTTRDSLMAGIYPAMQPLRLLGLSPERLTARLWLTMHYIEEDSAKQPKGRGLDWGGFRGVSTEQAGIETIRIILPRLNWADWLFLALVAAAIIGWLA